MHHDVVKKLNKKNIGKKCRPENISVQLLIGWRHILRLIVKIGGRNIIKQTK